jgi:hypothetical protein
MLLLLYDNENLIFSMVFRRISQKQISRISVILEKTVAKFKRTDRQNVELEFAYLNFAKAVTIKE